jgi:hypothetical protein
MGARVKWTAIVRRLQPLFVVLALLFVALLLRSQWDELLAHRWQLNPLWLAVATGLLLASWAVEIILWRSLLATVGGRLPYWSAVRIWFLSAVVRYIPGNIWQPLSLTLLGVQRGVPVAATLTSVILYQVIILLAVLPIATLYFGLTGNWGLLTDLLAALPSWLIFLGVVPVLVFVIWPNWLVSLVNWALRKIGRTPLPAGLSRVELVWALSLAILDWLLWGACFAALAFALQAYTPQQMVALAPHLVAIYAVAYAIGFVSFITPSGLGVREGAFFLLLAPLLGGGSVTAIAVGMRVFTTVGELIAAGVSLMLPDRRTVLGAPPTLATPAAAPETTELDLREGLT